VCVFFVFEREIRSVRIPLLCNIGAFTPSRN